MDGAGSRNPDMQCAVGVSACLLETGELDEQRIY